MGPFTWGKKVNVLLFLPLYLPVFKIIWSLAAPQLPIPTKERLPTSFHQDLQGMAESFSSIHIYTPPSVWKLAVLS